MESPSTLPKFVRWAEYRPRDNLEGRAARPFRGGPTRLGRSLLCLVAASHFMAGIALAQDSTKKGAAKPAAQDSTKKGAAKPAPQDSTKKTAADSTKPLTADQLDALVAPIALYPDELLGQTLVASTYPLEIVQLQQWLAKNPKLKDQALADSV